MTKRILYLVRHGQHASTSPPTDKLGNGLTALGKKQVKLAARRLSALPIRIIHHSTLRRAAETAQIIAAHFPGVELRPSRLLWECIPAPVGKMFAKMAPDLLRKHGPRRARRAFEQYFKRGRGGDRHEIIVCHGTLIRYFVCRALRASPNLWTNADSENCGISKVVVKPAGHLVLESYNDTGHLPHPLRTGM